MKFCATYWGNRSWVIPATDSVIAIDPVLGPSFGRPGESRLIYPPRTILWRGLPRLDAVVLTHEDADHVDLPSVAAMASHHGTFPVFTTERASQSLHEAIQALGLSTHVLQPFEMTSVGGFQIGTTGSNGLQPAALVVSHTAAGACFVRSTLGLWEEEWRWFRDIGLHPQVIALSFSTIDLRAQKAWTIISDDPSATLMSRIFEARRKIASRWAVPQGLILEDAGFCFVEDLAWMNSEVFPVTFDNIRHPGMYSAVPGDEFAVVDGILDRVPQVSPLVETAPRADWPRRARDGSVTWLERYGPACKKTECTEAELECIAAALNGFARHLYGRMTFRAVLSLTPGELGGRIPTFAVALIRSAGRGSVVFEYSAQGGNFAISSVEDPLFAYAAVFECWATDLAAVFRGEMEMAVIEYGRCRLWNMRPNRFHFEIIRDLIEYTHPLRRLATSCA